MFSIHIYHLKKPLLVLHINHTLRVGIAKVTLVRRADVNLGLIKGVLHLVGEHACRETRHHLLHVVLVGCMQNVIVDEDVVSQERQL